MDIRSWWKRKKKQKEIQSLSSNGLRYSTDGLRYETFGGYNVPVPAADYNIKFAQPLQIIHFNEGIIVIFTCQGCGLQQKEEFKSVSGDRKDAFDSIHDWTASITDAFPKCSSVCEALQAIAR